MVRSWSLKSIFLKELDSFCGLGIVHHVLDSNRGKTFANQTCMGSGILKVTGNLHVFCLFVN